MESRFQVNSAVKSRIKRLFTGKNALTTWEWLYCLLCFVFYMAWMMGKPLGYGPDEPMRASVAYYIFHHNALPHGNDPDVVNKLWGFSYAYYPQLIGAVFSAVFMKIAAIFTAKATVLVWAARFPSVLSGFFTVYFTMKAARRLFGRPYHWIMVVLVSTIPQFIFLSSYVNNDVIAVCSTSIQLCAWVYGIKDGWNVKNSVFLAVGISICALSYYDAYGWILASILLFFLSWWMSAHPELPGYRRKIWKRTALIVVVVAGCTSFFFIRNGILNHGDFLGLKTVFQASERWAIPDLKPSHRNTPYNLGLSLQDMLFDKRWQPINWITSTWRSFVGKFGWMSVEMPLCIYHYFKYLFLFACLCLLGNIPRLRSFFQRTDHKIMLVLYGCLLLSGFITLALTLQYSYYTDYEPQGRYIFTILPVLMFFISQGLVWFVKRFKQGTHRYAVVACICTIQIAIALYAYFGIFLPSPPNGL